MPCRRGEGVYEVTEISSGGETIDERFFPTMTGEDCFGVALANLLVAKDDLATAAKVYSSYQVYGRLNNGLCATIIPLAVRELTDGKYRGELLLDPAVYCTDPLLFSAVEKLVAARELLPLEGRVRFTAPAILLLGNGDTTDAVFHAVVYMGNTAAGHVAVDGQNIRIIDMENAIIKGVLMVSG